MQSRSSTDLWGADVSHHNGTINWTKAAGAGLQFVFIKASEGVGMIDDQLRRNALGADAVGIPAGFYHYARPEYNGAAAEAAAFAQAISGLPYKLPLILDIEGQPAAAIDRDKLTGWCDEFLREVKRLTGAIVGIYTGAYFARDQLGPALGKYPLWVAHYGPTTPLANSTWDRWAVFQVSDNGSCPGIGTGDVDMNAMDADFFNEIMAPAAEPEKEEETMTPEDANKIIAYLGASHGATSDPEAKEEFHRLANELRKVSGQPLQ